MDILEKSDKPLSRTQIADMIGIKPRKVSLVIRRLLKFKDIECLELDRFKAAEVLGWDRPVRRVRFYYCEGSSKSFS